MGVAGVPRAAAVIRKPHAGSIC
ncbi:hypothetical protein E2C01_100112 [Portunus trituberculatus]|uniref:Uncharacterized protein n=1 Tax=Portunus trituberculatus TaxID=210409 RepID=A0A5B7KC54_PORTR|nr:hypothetical protein [Portunus trituberculatus]